MRAIIVLLVGVVIGCASPNPGAVASAPGPDVRMTMPSGSQQVLNVGVSVVRGVANLQFPIDKVWNAMMPAYDSLSIPLSVLDATSHTIGNEGLTARRRIGKTRIGEYLNCGNGEGGPSADIYEINLSMVSRLQPNAVGGTTITTTVDGAAKPASFSGDYIKCATTGELEKRLVKIVEDKLW
ncbi:MAG TPA: hypothetical protein VGO33_13905 [Gemmatimonadaceae bacterium]|jgi:hypothetical protein|nr:hypothetical protein [Gemmatimonadaceae bacterium]